VKVEAVKPETVKPETVKPETVKPEEPRPKPKSPPATPVPAAPHPSGPPGFITIDSAPVYAVIYVDGKRLGETPLVHISLAPGHHVVRAVSPSGTTHTGSIAIESGKTAQPYRVEW
ncbi:MAG TPA: PEGA domain-containing protein, partial [Kofleriaceae bacterium]|nr:PEGA domain-containing protein [Kofleriaceae bacterium]